MKNIITFSLTLAICLLFNVTVSAKNVSYSIAQPYYDTAIAATSDLNISGTTATCTSVLRGNPDVTKIVVEQTLYFVNGNSMTKVSDANWTESFDKSRAVVVNVKANLSNGTYCLLSVFTVTTKSGENETIRVYSTKNTV